MAVALWVAVPDDAEAQAASRWARGEGIAVVEGEAPHPAGNDVLWIHAGSAVPLVDGVTGDRLRRWIEEGGVLACTLLATPLAQALGAPGPAPRQVPPMPWSHADDPRWPESFHAWPGYPHIRGCQGYGVHPLYRGLAGGTFTWMAREGDLVGRCEYLRPEWPDHSGAVIGVDRSYVHLDADIAVAWEYGIGRGNIRCIGAHVCFASGDPCLHPQRDALLRNLLTPDWGAAGGRTAWPRGGRHAPVTVIPAPRPLEPTTDLPPLVPSRRAPAGDAPITLGTPTGLMTGSESRGVTELWLHPLCLIDDGITVSTSGATVRATSCEVNGAHVERMLETEKGERWRERVLGGVERPVWWYELAPVGDSSASISIDFALPVRLAWPMPATALHPLRSELRREGTHAALLITGADARHRLAIAIDGAVDLSLESSDVAPRVRLTTAAGQGLRVAMEASHGQHVPRIPGSIGPDLVTAQQARWHDIGHRSMRLEDADGLASAFSWARTRLANFMATTLTGQRGLMAGFAPTRPGWNHSRPGYAWFFGRDTCWCVDALLALGLFEEARTALQLLHDTTDVTGKVAHEVSASGVAHYDAADATPLFLRAVASYAEYTGDTAALAAWWPVVRRALAFVASTDRDNDGLPENTLVGHGWIEMGPHGGGRITSYVASCWIDALRRLLSVADGLGDGALATEVRRHLASARRGLDALRLADGRLALHRDEVGELEPELTALAAVPVALGVEAGVVAAATMNALAEPRFQAPWGLRMLPVDSPRYAPRAYHGGAVWPLFTGWAALADAKVGKAERALERLKGIARLTTLHNVGAFDEVLDGDNGTAAGVCSDQAWSAAAMITPLMQGLLGIEGGNFGRACTIAVTIPGELDGLSVRGVRIGETRWSATWCRVDTSCTVELRHEAGPPLSFEPRDAAAFVLRPGERAVVEAREGT